MTPSETLESYRRKRSAGATPEPFGRAESKRPGLFVIQQHAARSLHFDLRLEIGGVLKSWALPKGPSLDPADKRLAVATEDHPVEYADFEGLIPAGNYGAGAMIVWDRGRSVHHLEPEQGLADGKLLFELHGYKVRGLWTLVRTRDAKQWLLIKKPDAWATGETAEELDTGSVLSGLEVTELATGSDKARKLRSHLAELPRAPVDLAKVQPMLAQSRRQPFSRPGWIFEIKYDGFRMLAFRTPPQEVGRPSRPRSPVRLLYRSGLDATELFPELTRALAALPYESLILDGEVVVLDEDARPNFHRLQQRARRGRGRDVERAAIEQPAAFFAFDLLAFEGRDLRGLPLAERKEILHQVLPKSGPLRYADHVEERGEDFYRGVRRLGLEGMMAKRADAPYRGGRSPDWLKVRADRMEDFVVLGFIPAAGGDLKALHLGQLENGEMRYAGKVGTGWTARQRRELRGRLEALRWDEGPPAGAPAGTAHAWVEPCLVAEVRFAERTPAGQLRHSSFQRLREDKTPGECFAPESHAAPTERPGSESPAEPAPRPRQPGPDEVPTSHREKIFWPHEGGGGTTKGDLLDYYRAIAPWLLPYLRDRPVVLDRYPDGIDGKSFFQKNAPDFVPDWVRTEAVWSEGSGKETRYFICDDEATLIYLINLGAIPLHLWSSRLDRLQTPDWCILDLDAKQASFAQAVRVAKAIHRLCEAAQLPSFVKTSGATGLHVLIPLGGRCTHEQARQLAEVLARLALVGLEDIASLARLPGARAGKVYVDTLQNGYGKLLVAPFSARPRPGAPVSMPLEWRQLTSRLEPGEFNLETAPRRMARLGIDPLRPVLDLEPDLGAVLRRLAELA